jgi:uncharacterized protein YlaI
VVVALRVLTLFEGGYSGGAIMCGKYMCLLCETEFDKCFETEDLDVKHIKNYFCSECTDKVEDRIEDKLNIQRADKYSIIADVLEDREQENGKSAGSNCLLCECEILKPVFDSATDAGDYVCDDCQNEFRDRVKNRDDIGKREIHTIIADSIYTQWEDKKSRDAEC